MAKEVALSDTLRELAEMSGDLFGKATYATITAPNSISIWNGKFWLAKDGGRIPAPDQLHLHFVVLGAKEPLGRTYYEQDFDKENVTRPNCYSYDGVTPEEDAVAKQSEGCKVCPKSFWGSAFSKGSGAQIMACRTHRDVVVKVLGAEGVWLWRIPGSSDSKRGSQTTWQAAMKRLDDVAKKEAAKHGRAAMTPLNCVIEATFDPEAVGYLNFEPRGYLPESEAKAVLEAARDRETISQMLWGPAGDARMEQWTKRGAVLQVARALPPKPEWTAPMIEEKSYKNAETPRMAEPYSNAEALKANKQTAAEADVDQILRDLGI